ncbi:DUF1367 family protein [Vibrio parahaemolyticus]|uniref:DUF1367 family protein n=1 Tax=Vibrio parahaemolyticus TaxID=670 RepID=UPI00226B3EFD|nr:DUF1367 family protein [Vibrio parahaemolyticus]MCX8818341.1 DUF1367 family protein [Vibrio parahaemolyticus]MCX8914823.1 DUF1367 family protein [Vibrio parahaemolyticus]
MQTVKRKKEKNEIVGVIGTGGYLQYVTPFMREQASELRGRIVAIKPVRTKKDAVPRIIEHHRKFFALLKLGFEYWSPDVDLVSEPERWAAHETAKRFCDLAGRGDMYETHGAEIADLVLSQLKQERKKRCDTEAYKCPENYRRKVMVDSGFFDLEVQPNGGTIKRPWSIAFENMTQGEFERIYKGCFSTIWNMSLFQVFANEQEVHNAVCQLMEFS